MKSELLSSAEQQVVPWFDSDRRLRRLGYWLTAVLVFGCGVWASFAPIDTGALAPGIVQVEGKRKSVQHLEGGIVAAIMVSNGDSVSKDDPLLSVDVTQANSELLILAGRRIDLQGKLDLIKKIGKRSRPALAHLSQKNGLQTTCRRKNHEP